MFFKKIFVGLVMFFTFFNLLLAEQPELKFRYIKVNEGDTFWKLFKDKWEIVSRINKIDRWHLLPGKTLKVPLDWELAKKYPFFPEFLEQEKDVSKLILVVIKEQFLAGYEYGEIKFWYPICSGMEKGLTPEWFLKMESEKEKKEKVIKELGRILTLKEGVDEALALLGAMIKAEPETIERPTPRGRFKVLYKDLNHQSSIYPEPDGGQPMPFTIMFSWKGYGLHAWGIPKHLKQWFEELVGDKIDLESYSFSGLPGWSASHGCIRLFLEDAQKLFEWVRVGTAVWIIDSFEDLILARSQ